MTDDGRAASKTGDPGWLEPQGFARLSRAHPGSHGYALYLAQRGGKHRDVKALSGFGSGSVVEAITDHRGDTFRAVYTVRFEDAIFVLHAFRKKSKAGRATPRRDMELIEKRLREAGKIAKGRE